MARPVILLLSLVLLQGCAARAPSMKDMTIDTAWAHAQIALAARTHGDSFLVENTWNWVGVDDRKFVCNGIPEAIGCALKTDRTIYYSTAWGNFTFAIWVHEAIHAILYELCFQDWVAWWDYPPDRTCRLRGN